MVATRGTGHYGAVFGQGKAQYMYVPMISEVERGVRCGLRWEEEVEEE